MNHWKSMRERVEDYLSARRRLGYKLQIEGQQLQRFARFAHEHGHTEALTVELAVAWANSSKKSSDLYRSRRLEIVRNLAKYCALFEPETEISPPGLLGPAHRRVTSYIYTLQELSDLLETASKLKPRNELRPATLRCLIGLLAATGLRISEAFHLTRADVDFEHKVLVVKKTKFRKSRYASLHPTTVDIGTPAL
jgi:integrase